MVFCVAFFSFLQHSLSESFSETFGVWDTRVTEEIEEERETERKIREAEVIYRPSSTSYLLYVQRMEKFVFSI